MTKSPHYPSVDANPNFAAIEEAHLAFWAENRVFEKSVAQRPAANADGSSNAYVFYDGPPFANGLPHYGHLLTGYVKDAIARYHTMLGRHVERRFGWDCHGLPAEMGAEKELGISGRAAIMHFGIDKFNDYCRTSVMKYTEDWRYYVTRQGRWVDFDNDYKTMDTPYMESVIWAFSELYKKGLIYESMRVMPYSWAAETPVSNFETRIDNATREREDKAATVKFKLTNPIGKTAATDYLAAWTTTPWTLPSNLALAVSRALNYLPVIDGSARLWLETNAALALAKQWAAKEQKEIIETARCVMRPFTTADLPLVLALHQHPDVAKTTYDGVESDEKIAAHLNDFIAHQKDHGFSQWAVFDRVSGAFMGRCGVTKRQIDPSRPAQLEIRCALLPEYWHGGIASECCYAWLLRSFATQPIEMMVGAAHAENLRSHAMMERLGYVFEKDLEMKNDTGPYFVLTRDAFLEANARSGADLIGLKYEPLFPYFDDEIRKKQNAFRVLDGSAFVTDGDGTGIVHMAPGFGEADQLCCANAEPPIEVIVPVDEKGRFTDAIFDLPDLKLHGLVVVPDTRRDPAGITVSAEDAALHIAPKDVEKYGLANMRIVRWLKAHGALVKDEPFKHNYPHCWRTDTPLIYRAMSSWYVNVQAIKENMAANNLTIHWIPDHIQSGQMGKGIESAPDWSISRNRFWGTPLPIWRSTNPRSLEPIKVFGSISELEKFFGVQVPDLHRPFIDTLVASDGDGHEYRRVEDVFDCWFESGSMPYAQLHYPFENKKQFEENFPADFITEYITQTRGWFYTLQVLSAALFGKAPFKNVICHGILLGEPVKDENTGKMVTQKLSKRLQNYPDIKLVLNQYGADALRWMMLSSPVMRGAEMIIDKEGAFIRDVVRLNIKPIWSAYNFFTLYANADGVKAKLVVSRQSSVVSKEATGPLLETGDRRLETNLLDRYILAKCKAAIGQVRASLDAYDTPGATDAITAFFEVLNNWYIRRSRARFWGSDVTPDKQAAYDTLFTVLNLMCIAAAPLLPFTTEAIYRGLNGASHSVHLQDFADVSSIDSDVALVADMDRVRDACTAMASIRSTENIRNRQPLASATFYGAGADRLRGFAELMMDELNVKDVRFADSLEGVAEYSLTIHFPIAGKRLGGKMKDVGAAAKAGKWERDATGAIIVGGEKMEEGEYNLQLKPLVARGAQRLSTNDALVVLDLTITPELLAEGRARDLVRMIQQARKDGGFDVADRVALALELPEDFKAALTAHRDYIAEQTLAISVNDHGAAGAEKQMKQELDGAQFIIGITKAA